MVFLSFGYAFSLGMIYWEFYVVLPDILMKLMFEQVLISGYSYGGLSELSETDYFSCSMGSTIAGEIGIFGHKPSLLMDMLAGKRAEVGTKLGPYMRTFSADCSPTDLETALQVGHLNFCFFCISSVYPILYVLLVGHNQVSPLLHKISLAP